MICVLSNLGSGFVYGRMSEGENVSAHEWPRCRSLLDYNLRTIFSFTPALRVKRCPRPAASDIRALTRFTQKCLTSYPLPTVNPSMKSEEDVSLRRRQIARITFMSNNIPTAQEAQSAVATVGLTGKYLVSVFNFSSLFLELI
ncbi:hypothetical protein ARMGADRAFT_1086327 [Armillaria gallica]|uniref:Uncharacterized protein n=1 Tax=Armillaria gallica TaxID=47427 RepID=A0A2H3DHA4_ARMGA|nr:hypothetical protein ARMGADRAFT_1086327 [Armillaria gallica]